MFEPFSNSYYIGRLFVTPAESDRPRMQQANLEWINEAYIAEDEELTRLDQPLVMKLGARHFPVHGDVDIPEGTLALPDAYLDEADVDNPPSVCSVLLAKGERARQLLWLTGQSTLGVGE
ncbi:MAG: DUF5802 family protein [Halobacteriota archaeon]